MSKVKILISFLVAVVVLFRARALVFATTVEEVVQTYLGVTFGETCSTTEVTGIICIGLKLVNYLLGTAGIVSLVFLVIGGLRYMASGGDEKALTAAKSTITYAVLGLFIIVGATLGVNTILSTLLPTL